MYYFHVFNWVFLTNQIFSLVKYIKKNYTFLNLDQVRLKYIRERGKL